MVVRIERIDNGFIVKTYSDLTVRYFANAEDMIEYIKVFYCVPTGAST